MSVRARRLLVAGLVVVSAMAVALVAAWFGTLDLHGYSCVPRPDVFDSECAWKAPSDLAVWGRVALAQSLVLAIACLFAFLAYVFAAAASARWRSRRRFVTAGLGSAWGLGSALAVMIDRHVYASQWLDWAEFRSDVLGQPYSRPTDELAAASAAAGWALAAALAASLACAWRAARGYRASR